jgi:hypothetical protein
MLILNCPIKIKNPTSLLEKWDLFNSSMILPSSKCGGEIGRWVSLLTCPLNDKDYTPFREKKIGEFIPLGRWTGGMGATISLTINNQCRRRFPLGRGWRPFGPSPFMKISKDGR